MGMYLTWLADVLLGAGLSIAVGLVARAFV